VWVFIVVGICGLAHQVARFSATLCRVRSNGRAMAV
jgi:hypothetical protein